jgi:acylphosphatase
MPHLDIRVTGRVQGVFFRAETQRTARALGVTGFVRNEADGSVTIEAEGDDDALARFQDWLREGPDAARVEHVEATPGPWRGFAGFEVQR